MGESGHTYDDVLASATARLDENVASMERETRAAGGRFLSRTVLVSCLREAVEKTVGRLSDGAILSVLATRPELLHADPEAYGQQPTPREAMEHSLVRAVRSDLNEVAVSRLGEGQDADTLPEAVAAALAAMDEIIAGGVRFRDAEDTRRILQAGEWDVDLGYGMGSFLSDFLVRHGRRAEAGDLMAAIESREVAMEGQGAPTPR